MRDPTPVQRNCIPTILQGKDTLACAKTGSGKTAAFALPILHTLAIDPFGVYAVVLTPTRELAFQIADQFRVLGAPLSVRDCVVVGGVDMVTQALELVKRPHIVIATPGRLADHLSDPDMKAIFRRTRYLVLDEADRLITNSTLQHDIATILHVLPATRQNLLFSATLKTDLAASGSIYAGLHHPLATYSAPSSTATVAALVQHYLFIPSQVRHAYFINLMRRLDPEAPCIVFTSTCRSCEELALMLRELGLRCVALHFQMAQTERLGVLGKFKSNVIKILVATDVASRGLDIPAVQTVVNFNIPKAVDDYIHRVGRTARAGRGGQAISLVSERDIELIHAIEDTIQVRLTESKLVAEHDVLRSLNEINMARRAASLRLMETDFGERKR
jgi:ATP-dependent RNA helicase DDX49/DBP8